MSNHDEGNQHQLNANPPKYPNIMITGANGFTGTHACQYFMKAKYHVTAVSRNPTHQKSNRLITYEHCDLTNKIAVQNLIEKTKPDFLLHLAGQNQIENSWNNPVASLEANVMSTAYLLEALRNEYPSCKIIVVGSSLDFTPTDITSLQHPFGLTKTLQTLIAQSWEMLYAMNVIIAKPTNLIGPGISNGVCSILAKKVIDMEFHDAEKMLKISNLHVRRDFLDVRDAIVAYDTLFKRGVCGETYTISSGKFQYLKDLTDALRLFSSIEFGIRTLNNHVELVEAIKPTLLKKLGWKPLISFEESIRDTLNFYREIELNPF